MAQWFEAVLFGLTLLAFVMGVTHVVLAALPNEEVGPAATKTKVENLFFALSGIVLFVLFSYGLTTI